MQVQLLPGLPDSPKTRRNRQKSLLEKGRLLAQVKQISGRTATSLQQPVTARDPRPGGRPALLGRDQARWERREKRGPGVGIPDVEGRKEGDGAGRVFQKTPVTTPPPARSGEKFCTGTVHTGKEAVVQR